MAHCDEAPELSPCRPLSPLNPFKGAECIICCWVGAAEGKATTVSIAKFLGRSDAAVRSSSRSKQIFRGHPTERCHMPVHNLPGWTAVCCDWQAAYVSLPSGSQYTPFI